MGLRITTWNVNGIRNPFGYQPWRDNRTFAAMFNILEADIIVMQETKIQRKDLRDDMVLVPGWDVYFSLPKYKKGYSGVAIYTRNAVCAPIRAEEGITGALCPPNSTTSYFDLPENEQIGGYPSFHQLADSSLDATTLDSEGRCVILEFAAFVLIGVYNPANRDESRDEFRLGFLNALDARVRNLVAAGKRVFLAGDLNIIREEIDTANAEEQLRKHGMTGEEYVSTPARRLFNQLLVGGKVLGETDKGRERPVLWDICRSFHPGRKGMFTCWEVKKNARPGNFGSRIDYVLCSPDWKDWFEDSNIQEGLMGSDHCPVYATIKEKVEINGELIDVRDVMNPPGMFKDGIRVREWSAKDLLPLSAKLIPEFDRRRNIRDMFVKKSSVADESPADLLNGEGFRDEDTQSTTFETPRAANSDEEIGDSAQYEDKSELTTKDKTVSFASNSNSKISDASKDIETVTSKRQAGSAPPSRPSKRGKSGALKSAQTKGPPPKGQSSLMGFFKPKTLATNEISFVDIYSADDDSQESNLSPEVKSTGKTTPVPSGPATPAPRVEENIEVAVNDSPDATFKIEDQKDVIDPIVSKESWSKLLGKRVVPRCEHNEPCMSMLTKKAGINCGRSFYMCSRPLGPSGEKERGTQWRCGTFIWSSDWTGDKT